MPCATSLWLENRDRIDWRNIELPISRARKQPSYDVIRNYIFESAVSRDVGRAKRLDSALSLERDDRTNQEPLNIDTLLRWQALIEPSSASLRKTSAYAKQGDEEYCYWDGIWEEFEKHLKDTDNSDVPLPSKAARAYLDICFFHPFLDGNGRCALLVLDYILGKGGAGLQSTGLLFRIPYYADDLSMAINFVRQLNMLIVPV